MTKAGKKEKKEIHICQECGKEIVPDEVYEYVVTKRRTELWFHRRCIGGKKR